ncbi:MAG: MFS transporter [Proteobacteria bacterium]|nr:MFS transporter [Pseudomonadota bacterium]
MERVPSLWGHADFMRLWSAQAISAFGSRITRTALPIIAVQTLAQPESMVGLLVALQLAPGFVLALFAGGFVDRGHKRRILVFADVFRAVVVATLSIAWLLGLLAIAQVIVVGALVGAASALFQITDVAYLPSLVARDQLAEGNAKLETTEAIAEICGPASAGALIAAIGAPLAVALDAASYLWSAFMLGGIRGEDPPVAHVVTRRQWVADLRLGLRTIFTHPIVRPLVVAHGMWSISGGFFMALYTVFCLRTLHLSTATFGAIIAVGGIGSLGGAIVSRWLVAKIALGPTLLVTSTLSVAGALLIPLAGGGPVLTIGVLVAHQFVSDGFAVAFVIQAVTLRQTVLPKATLGRANAAIHVFSGSMLALGAVVAGVLAEAIGTRAAVWVGVILGLLVPVLLAPLASLRAMPDAPDAPPQG